MHPLCILDMGYIPQKVLSLMVNIPSLVTRDIGIMLDCCNSFECISLKRLDVP